MLMSTIFPLTIKDNSDLLRRCSTPFREITNTAEKYSHKKSSGYDRSLNLDLVTFPLGKRLDQA